MNLSRTATRRWLALLFILSFSVVAATRLEAQRGMGGGPGWGRGGGAGSGRGQRGEGRKKENIDPEESRFLDVCRSLKLNEEQINKAQSMFDRLQKDKQALRNEQEIGSLSIFDAESEMKKIVAGFEKKFVSILDDRQSAGFLVLKKKAKSGAVW